MPHAPRIHAFSACRISGLCAEKLVQLLNGWGLFAHDVPVAACCCDSPLDELAAMPLPLL